MRVTLLRQDHVTNKHYHSAYGHETKKISSFLLFPLTDFWIYFQLTFKIYTPQPLRILFLYQFKISVNSENIYRHRYGPINGSFDIRNGFFFMTFLFLISLSTNFLANHVIADTTGFVDRLMSIWQVNRKSQDRYLRPISKSDIVSSVSRILTFTLIISM